MTRIKNPKHTTGADAREAREQRRKIGAPKTAFPSGTKARRTTLFQLALVMAGSSGTDTETRARSSLRVACGFAALLPSHDSAPTAKKLQLYQLPVIQTCRSDLNHHKNG